MSGSTLEIKLYYRDGASNQVTVAATTATYDTTVFSNITHLLDFEVIVPTVQTNDAWAGQNIGIQLQSTVPANLIGGVWDVENVRLTETIAVPNFSFESPTTSLADPRIDSWQKAAQLAAVSPPVRAPRAAREGLVALRSLEQSFKIRADRRLTRAALSESPLNLDLPFRMVTSDPEPSL